MKTDLTLTNRIANRIIAMLLVCVVVMPAFGQGVGVGITEIITDYKGYWKSTAGLVSSIKPDNNHNLLAFTYKGIRYSTGVNDVTLATRGQAFSAGTYKALPVSHITGTINSMVKCGMGQLFDGVDNGASVPAPQNNIPKYLTDGINGLNIGTGAANLPAGDLFFPISGINLLAIGDNIPDLVITQIADPTGSLDSYEFTDINGNSIGTKVDIQLDNLPIIGNWLADFYDAHTTPMPLTLGYTKTQRPIRLWTADFSAFGINAGNIGQIAYFKIRLNGNSDVGFVAYNEKAFSIGHTILPINLSYLRGEAINGQSVITWKSQTELSSNKFVVETSIDGVNFTTVDSVKATGTAGSTYSYIHRSPVAGTNWYRLKMVDNDGASEYSKVITLSFEGAATSVRVFPNPTANTLFVKTNSPVARKYEVRNMAGMLLLQQNATSGAAQVSIQVQHLPKGMYTLLWTENGVQKAKNFVKK